MKKKFKKIVAFLLVFSLIFNINVIDGISIGIKAFAMEEEKGSLTDNYYIDYYSNLYFGLHCT